MEGTYHYECGNFRNGGDSKFCLRHMCAKLEGTETEDIFGGLNRISMIEETEIFCDNYWGYTE